jgi:Ni/Co efflux regulator RcnB
MRKGLAAAAACIVLAASAISPAASAASRHHNGDREQFMQNYCSRHNDSDCRDWSGHRDRWDEARYHRWYQRHRHDHDFDAGDSAAAIFGFAAGTAAGLITGAINGGATGSHVAVCQSRYRSYDPATNTFMGHDGYRHECRL